MGVDLSSRDRHMHLGGLCWDLMLYLTEKHGWKPQGTVMDLETLSWWGEDLEEDETPEELEERKKKYVEDWDGDYSCNAGQRVTEEDACNMADALEKALENDDIFVDCEQCIVGKLTKTPFMIDHRKAFIKDFIDFCRLGSFQIF